MGTLHTTKKMLKLAYAIQFALLQSATGQVQFTNSLFQLEPAILIPEYFWQPSIFSHSKTGPNETIYGYRTGDTRKWDTNLVQFIEWSSWYLEVHCMYYNFYFESFFSIKEKTIFTRLGDTNC
jgi:hypothetical protein